LDWFLDLAVVEKTGHQSWLGFANGGDDDSVEGNNDDAGNLSRFAKRADKCMFPAPRAARFHLEIENNIVAFCKLENFFERGNAFSGEGTAEPGTCIEAAELRKAEVMDGALAISGAIYGVIVNCDETRVTGELQVGFDKTEAHGNGLAKRRHGVFG